MAGRTIYNAEARDVYHPNRFETFVRDGLGFTLSRAGENNHDSYQVWVEKKAGIVIHYGLDKSGTANISVRARSIGQIDDLETKIREEEFSKKTTVVSVD